jgi:hypothetical protein
MEIKGSFLKSNFTLKTDLLEETGLMEGLLPPVLKFPSRYRGISRGKD